MAKVLMLATSVLAFSCTGVRPVQVQPPIPVPPGLISGYGVEKIAGNPQRARQAAYLKAMDDLLTRSGPVLVSKTVQDQTTVVDLKPPSRVLESTFRLRASRMLQPSFQDTGMDHGFVWVLLATTDDEIQRGWQQFVEWRAQRIDQAQKLFQDAKGLDRVSLLKASLALLEDAGAADDPGMLYFQVKAALVALETFQKEFRVLTDSGQLAAAEASLDQAQRAGLDQPAYQKCTAELSERRAQAMHLIEAGDDLLRGEQYKQAINRYEQARKIDRDNSLLPGKIAMAERYQREAHSRAVRATVGFVVPAATQVMSEYFAYKREEERRKREEAERAAEEARKQESGDRERDHHHRGPRRN
jgi:tetratricopeptide (TPR) repeat protein